MQYEDLPEGLNLMCKCVREFTGSVVMLKVPRHITPNDFGEWTVENSPTGFEPVDVLIATDEQCEAME